MSDSNAASGDFIPAGGWLPAGGVVQIRCTWESVALMGDAEIRPAVEFSDSLDGSRTVVAIGSFESTADFRYPSGWTALASYANGNQMFRVGWQVRNSVGTDVTGAQVAGLFEIEIP